jgi:hypothetical protein
MVNHPDPAAAIAWLQQQARDLDGQLDRGRALAEQHDLLPPRWLRVTLRALVVAGLVLLAIVAYMVAVTLATGWLTSLYQQAASR